LIYDEPLGGEQLSITRIMNFRVDSDLLTQARKGAQDDNRSLALLRYLKRFLEPDVFRRLTTGAIQQRPKLLPAEYGQIF